MTSEVVVMNRMGIALAADSVVSINENGTQMKRHNSVAKLFMMSERDPVGIMVYNNASLLGVPWETVIKLFRRQLGKDSLRTLEEYGQELIHFLKNHQSLFPLEVQQKYFRREFKSECYRIQQDAEMYLRLLSLEQETEFENREEARASIIEAVISDRLERWKKQNDAEGFDEQMAKKFLDRMSGEVSGIVGEVLLDWRPESSEVNQLNDIACHLIFKHGLDMESHTGLVIGGFGEQEHFPVVQHIVVYGMYGDTLKYSELPVKKISEASPSYIESFAETEAVNDYLFGVSSKFLDEIVGTIDNILAAPGRVLQEVTGMRKDKKAKLIRNTRLESEKNAEDIREKINLLMVRRFGGILDVVDILPLKELAGVASTLVRLSSFDKQLSLEEETVGEPIDVAVISKGDGFIWINRKHYFQADLNHRYFHDCQQDHPTKEESHGKKENRHT